jgi:cytochrome c oxidase cbb3-type subunit 1
MTNAEAERPLLELELIRGHLVAGFCWFLVALLAGLFYALQFLNAYPFPEIELLSPGRVRMVHTNLIAYGFLLNSFTGALYWAVPRLTGRPLYSAKLGRAVFWLLQVGLLAIGGLILGGRAQAVEWGETPVITDPVVVAIALMIFANIGQPILRMGNRPVYVSLWYFSAAIVWTALTYLMGNYLPEFFVPGAAGGAIIGLFIHDLVGLFVTPLGWGIMYYFVPVILGRPIYSHALSLIGFWGLAFFYPLNGVHHFLWSPIPMYAQYGAVISTIAVEIVVTTVIVNFFMTLRNQPGLLRSNLPIRWFYTGMVMYFTTCLQCAIQVTLTVQKIIHFTDWVVGHAHLVMFGVFGFWLLGITTYLWPRLVGREWYSARLNRWHYWLSVVGLGVMFVDLVIAGLIQGFSWRALAPWEDSLVSSSPFWSIRLWAGLTIIVGQLCFAWNMYKTWALRGSGERSTEVPANQPVA